MRVRDILLQMNSYPAPTPSWAIEGAAYLAERLDAKLAAAMCQVQIPDVSNYLSQLLVRSRDVIAAENQKSAYNASQSLLKFDLVVDIERRGETIVIESPALVTPWQLAMRARSHDLTIVPIYDHPEARSVAEGLVFESGRPVLLLPARGVAGHRFDEVVIAWDGSRAAARALADGLALSELAQSVTIATVRDDKDLATSQPAADVVRNLALHGIAARIVEVPAEGRDAGSALLAYCEQINADLLVMGAYGHARAREFILGGATRSVLNETEIPVLFSH